MYIVYRLMGNGHLEFNTLKNKDIFSQTEFIFTFV